MSFDREVRIPVNEKIFYKCFECLDTGIVTQGYDEFILDIPCPLCNNPDFYKEDEILQDKEIYESKNFN